MEKYKILCSGSLLSKEIGSMEEELTKKINKEMPNYDTISMVGTNDRICVLMYMQPGYVKRND